MVPAVHSTCPLAGEGRTVKKNQTKDKEKCLAQFMDHFPSLTQSSLRLEKLQLMTKNISRLWL